MNENQYGIMVYRLAFHPWKLRLQVSILQGQEAKGLHEEDQASMNDVIGIPTCHIFFFSFKDRIENRKVNIQNLFYVSSPFTRYSQKLTSTQFFQHKLCSVLAQNLTNQGLDYPKLKQQKTGPTRNILLLFRFSLLAQKYFSWVYLIIWLI